MDISNENDLKDLLLDGSLSIKEKIEQILDEVEGLMEEIRSLEYARDYGDWDCDECYEKDSEIRELEALIPDRSIDHFIIKQVNDNEIVLENHLSQGQTWNWLPGNKLGLVQGGTE